MSNASILLIHPPVAKPCEPPAGLARLAQVLKAAHVDCRVYDASLDGLLWLLRQPITGDDTWSRRAAKHREANLAALRSPKPYRNQDRYKRVVMDLNRALTMAGRSRGAEISLSNFRLPDLVPVRSRDLLRAAESPGSNPFYPAFASTLERLFTDKAPEIVGLSINFMSQALCAFAMIGFVRSLAPDARIVCGGGLITSWMHIPGFKNPFEGWVDEMISGPGEQTLLAMCTGQLPDDDAGISYDYNAFELERYLSPGRILPYSTSQGCYWQKCAFCPEKTERRSYLPDAPSAVASDLQAMHTRFDPGLIHFLDNTLSPKFMAHLIANPPGRSWYGFVRITPHLADPDFVSGLKDSGCVMLKLGVESGDQAVLDALNKGVDLAVVSGALQMLKQMGIATYVYLLFGTPAENPDRARKTLDFTLKHADAIDFLNLAIFNLPAYSDEAAALSTVPFYDGDLSLYRDFIHPEGWQRDQVRRFLAREFKKPAVIRTILNNDPPFFTSNHAAFFHHKGIGGGRQIYRP